MKFVRSEYSLSIVTDQDVNNSEEKKSILNNLNKFDVEFSLTMRKFFPSNYDYESVEFEKVRISEVHEDSDSVDLMVFKDTGSLVMRNISIEDLEAINAVTMKNKIMDEYIRVSRWDLLEFEK